MTDKTERSETMLPCLERLPGLLKTQDNRITQNPIFVVQKRVKDFGFDSEYSDDYEWYDVEDNETAGEEEAKKLDELEASMESTYPWGKVYIKERWQFVQPFFTEKSAQEYMASNKHNLGECRIFVESGYRNHEWEAVREYFKSTRPDAKDTAAECHKCRGTGTTPMGGNDGASCDCDCPIGRLRDHTIKALAAMLGNKEAELATANKERDEAVEYIEGILRGFKAAGEEDEYVLEKFKGAMEHMQEFLDYLNKGE